MTDLSRLELQLFVGYELVVVVVGSDVVLVVVGDVVVGGVCGGSGGDVVIKTL